jgi:hypothetical protein
VRECGKRATQPQIAECTILQDNDLLRRRGEHTDERFACFGGDAEPLPNELRSHGGQTSGRERTSGRRKGRHNQSGLCQRKTAPCSQMTSPTCQASQAETNGSQCEASRPYMGAAARALLAVTAAAWLAAAAAAEASAQCPGRRAGRAPPRAGGLPGIDAAPAVHWALTVCG